MRASLAGILILLGVMGVAMDAAAEADQEIISSQPPLIVDHKNTVTINSGSYHLSSRNQDFSLVGPESCSVFFGCGHTASPISNDFETASKDVYGFEYGRHIKHGFSYGLSYFQIQNSFAIPSLTPSQGKLKARFIFGVIKKYFGDTDGLQPFIGAGVGRVDLNVSGSVNDTAGGSAALASAGLRYNAGHINFVAEYRFVRTSGMSLEGNTDITGDVNGTLKLSGRGNFVGMGINF
jgi:opacity protein-like surface antigen